MYLVALLFLTAICFISTRRATFENTFLHVSYYPQLRTYYRKLLQKLFLTGQFESHVFPRYVVPPNIKCSKASH